MAGNFARTLFAHARRRALHAAFIAVIAIPLWLLLRGGFAGAFTWKNAGMVLIAIAIVWPLLVITDMILEALNRTRPNRRF